jgi:hypothetical protein
MWTPVKLEPAEQPTKKELKKNDVIADPETISRHAKWGGSARKRHVTKYNRVRKNGLVVVTQST